MKKLLFYQLAIFLIMMPMFLSSAQADGFWDQDFRVGTLRSDFDDRTTGLSSNPLIQVQCKFPGITFAIPCKTFDTPDTPDPNDPNQITSFYPKTYSFYWPSSVAWPTNSDGYWVLSVNNEDVVNKFNLGPPNQSLPVTYSDVIPGQGPQLDRITGRGTTNIAMELRGQQQEKKRIHLAINTKYQPGNENFSQEIGSIPFLGFGAMQNRGNKGISLGALNDASKPHMLHFTTKMWGNENGVVVPRRAEDKPGRPAILSYMLFVFSKWNGVPRGIILQLFHRHQEFSCPNGISAIRDRHGNIQEQVNDAPFCNGKTQKSQSTGWNWPIKQSVFSPGADYTYIDVEDLQTVCNAFFRNTTVSGNPNNGWRLGYREESTYNIDLQELFDCANSLGINSQGEKEGFNGSMPNYSVPITGVFWTLEASGVDGLIWTSVEDMRLE
ncbi:MAG: hypothetical protein V3V18_14120 [Methylococcales bacterium]